MRHDAPALAARQLWDLPVAKTTAADAARCTPFTLPSNGVLSLADSIVTLTSDVIFQPECTGSANEGVSLVDDLKDPFYASTIPQAYVIGAATVIAWVLVVMLTVTPRTTFFGHPSASPSFGNGRGIIGGATGGGSSLSGVGSRPWLQKVAALTVAVSLTIATADTFKVAQKQYTIGYMNANALRDEVLSSLEIRVTRVITDVFLWLAQVQTLIRLFPRHKEKVLIKWIGFALIVCDSIFSCLNSFYVKGTDHPRHFADAIPALSYLFELALGLLYAAWVMYYAVTRRRYAFYHPKMRNICVIALLSLVAILTPVVFFVTDVSNQDVAGWGDYFRWVGSAAASVVVWEWVERIEALERDEKKDGILGREVFDGDEMLDVTPSEEAIWINSRRHSSLRRGGGDGDDRHGGNQSSGLEHNLIGGMAQRFRGAHQRPRSHFPLGRAHSSTTGSTPDPSHAVNGNGRITFRDLPKPNNSSPLQPVLGGPTPPPPVVSPVSRSDTTSAGSTVYVIRHDTIAEIPQPVRRRHDHTANGSTAHTNGQAQAPPSRMLRGTGKDEVSTEVEEDAQPDHDGRQNRWHAVTNPFKRKRVSPPVEVQQAHQAAAAAGAGKSTTPARHFARWDIKGRLGVFAAETGDRIRDWKADRRQDIELPVTVIPAQPRGSNRMWSPDESRQERSEAPSGVPEASRGQPEPAESEVNELTTLTPTGGQVASQSQSSPGAARASAPSAPASRRTTASPSHTVATTPLGPAAPPPRASDISPVGGNKETVVIPAPRRPQLRVTTPTPSNSHDHGTAGPAAAFESSRVLENG